MCSCGSRVFFDALGDPWPKHEDSCVAHYVRTLRQSGRSDEAIRALVADEARRRGATVPKSVEQLLTRFHDESKAIVELHPEKQKRQFAGVVQAVDQVNFLKRFKRKDNAAGRLGFDQLLDESHVEVVMRTEPDPGSVYQCEVRAFMPQSAFAATKFGVRDKVLATLKPHSLLDGSRVWLLETIKRT